MCLKYLKFLYQSTNQHGVHSPFVFSLLTKGIYSKDKKWNQCNKKENFIPRIIDYFKPQSVWLCKKLEQKLPLSIKVEKNDSKILNKVDLIWIGIPCNDTVSQLQNLIDAMHNDSVLLVDKSEQTKELKKLWQNIVKDARFTVTIDFYYYGLAFIRREQVKQHFTLRM
jgi:hypothetical protein